MFIVVVLDDWLGMLVIEILRPCMQRLVFLFMFCTIYRNPNLVPAWFDQL